MRTAQFPDGLEGRKAFAEVTAGVADIDAFNNQKQTGRRDNWREKLAAKEQLVKRLGTLARSARVLGSPVPGADAKLPPLTRGTTCRYLSVPSFWRKPNR